MNTEILDAMEVCPRPPSGTRTDLPAAAVDEIARSLNVLLADMFALYVKTKNFHWHVSGPHFRDYHLLLDEQATQIFATTDTIAERVRKLGKPTLRSIGEIARLQRVADNESDDVAAREMLTELLQNNIELTANLRKAHALCDRHGDVATASLIETWIDEAEQRSWFLSETLNP
jgi:starvation-inducible DNA-binding protein